MSVILVLSNKQSICTTETDRQEDQVIQFSAHRMDYAERAPHCIRTKRMWNPPHSAPGPGLLLARMPFFWGTESRFSIVSHDWQILLTTSAPSPACTVH